MTGVPGHVDREPPDRGTDPPPGDVVRGGHLLRRELHPQQVVLRHAPEAQPAGQEVRRVRGKEDMYGMGQGKGSGDGDDTGTGQG